MINDSKIEITSCRAMDLDPSALLGCENHAFVTECLLHCWKRAPSSMNAALMDIAQELIEISY